MASGWFPVPAMDSVILPAWLCTPHPVTASWLEDTAHRSCSEEQCLLEMLRTSPGGRVEGNLPSSSFVLLGNQLGSYLLGTLTEPSICDL